MCFVFIIYTTGCHCQSLEKFTFVGCYKSFSSWDVFKDSLSELQCQLTAQDVQQGVCLTGNCDAWSYSYICSNTQCFWSACSKYYFKIYSAKMTNEMCTQICINTLNYTYAGTNQG